MDMKEILDMAKSGGIKLFYGLLTLAIGFFLIHWLMKLLKRKSNKLKINATVQGFIYNLIRVILSVLVVLTAANTVGIPITSIVTLIASAGVAVSLAMQGALGNLVGGLMLLILQPIKAGEYVKVGDNEGSVITVGAFYTEMITVDRRRIFLPNSSLTNTAIVNFSREGTRRLDLTYSVAYASDMDKVYETLRDVVGRCPKLLTSPAPEIHLSACADSSLDFVLRVWLNAADYWEIYYYLTDEGKRALDRAGIEIPYPQMDVHIKQS